MKVRWVIHYRREPQEWVKRVRADGYAVTTFSASEAMLFVSSIEASEVINHPQQARDRQHFSVAPRRVP